LCAAVSALDLLMAPAGSGSSSSKGSGTEHGSRNSVLALAATPEKWLYKACTGGTTVPATVRACVVANGLLDSFLLRICCFLLLLLLRFF